MLYSLAAVDMHTANHIYEQCLSGELLRGRTVILVTHHIALCLPNASYLVELSGGRVAHQRTIADLLRSGHLARVDEDKPVIKPVVESPISATIPLNEANLISTGGKPSSEMSKSPKGKLVEEEARAEGRVQISTYLTYLRASGWFTWVLTLLLMLSIRCITIGNQVRKLCLVYLVLTLDLFPLRCSLLSGDRHTAMRVPS